MDFFVVDPVTFENGKSINGITSALWVERYLDPGEFKFTCLPTPELRAQLAIGSYVSHTDTLDLMIVESHEITEDSEGAPELIVSGRDMTAILEDDVVVVDYTSGVNGRPGFYMPEIDTGPFPRPDDWVQRDIPNSYKYWTPTPMVFYAQHVIEHSRAMQGPSPFDPADPSWTPYPRVGSFTIPIGSDVDTNYNQTILRQGQTLPVVLDLLEKAGRGLKVRRTRLFETPTAAHYGVEFIPHKGVDRTANIHFSVMAGDLKNARYLWSRIGEKNSAVVVGQYHTVYIYPPSTSIPRRILFVDASDITDRYLSYKDPASKLADIEAALTARGVAELRQHKSTTIVEATATRNNRYAYRKDYNIGDIIKVVGEYGVEGNMRVTEYTETEDAESGESGYPTLSAV